MPNPDQPESNWQFLKKLWSALLRLIALGIFGGVHWLLEKGLVAIIPLPWTPAKQWIEAVSFVVFVAIYVYLLFDALKVFIPALHSLPYPGQEQERVRAQEKALEAEREKVRQANREKQLLAEQARLKKKKYGTGAK
jgi:hypothetical protein